MNSTARYDQFPRRPGRHLAAAQAPPLLRWVVDAIETGDLIQVRQSFQNNSLARRCDHEHRPSSALLQLALQRPWGSNCAGWQVNDDLLSTPPRDLRKQHRRRATARQAGALQGCGWPTTCASLPARRVARPGVMISRQRRSAAPGCGYGSLKIAARLTAALVPQLVLADGGIGCGRCAS